MPTDEQPPVTPICPNCGDVFHHYHICQVGIQLPAQPPELTAERLLKDLAELFEQTTQGKWFCDQTSGIVHTEANIAEFHHFKFKADAAFTCDIHNTFPFLASQLHSLRSELATAKERIGELETRQWQDISTAPKDGTEILGWREDCGVILIRWTSAAEFLTQFELDALNSIGDAEKEDWFCADFVTGARLEGEETPTHWMPLPEPPTSHSTKAEGENS